MLFRSGLARTASVPAAGPATVEPARNRVPAPGPRRRPAVLDVMRPVALHTANAARLAFGSLAFWAYPAWGTSPYWESIPPAAPGEAGLARSPYPHRPPAHAGPPAR